MLTLKEKYRGSISILCQSNKNALCSAFEIVKVSSRPKAIKLGGPTFGFLLILSFRQVLLLRYV